MDSARKKILNKIHSATKKIHTPVYSNNVSVFPHSTKSLLEDFQYRIEQVQGNVYITPDFKTQYKELEKLIKKKGWKHIYCQEKKLFEKLIEAGINIKKCKKIPKNIEAGISTCESLIASTGSVLVSTGQGSGRQMFSYPPEHIVITSEKQLVRNIGDAYKKIIEKYITLPSFISLITGPSRTADIEKTLVIGAHGPKALHVFIHK